MGLVNKIEKKYLKRKDQQKKIFSGFDKEYLECMITEYNKGIENIIKKIYQVAPRNKFRDDLAEKIKSYEIENSIIKNEIMSYLNTPLYNALTDKNKKEIKETYEKIMKKLSYKPILDLLNEKQYFDHVMNPIKQLTKSYETLIQYLKGQNSFEKINKILELINENKLNIEYKTLNKIFDLSEKTDDGFKKLNQGFKDIRYESKKIYNQSKKDYIDKNRGISSEFLKNFKKSTKKLEELSKQNNINITSEDIYNMFYKPQTKE